MIDAKSERERESPIMRSRLPRLMSGSAAVMFGAFVVTTLAAGPSSATTITLSNFRATWQNVAPPGVVGLNFSGNGTADAQVNWGTAAGAGGQSGYRFQAAAPAPVDVPPSPSPEFVIGTFTHINEPIASSPTPSSITGVQLMLLVDVNIGGTDEGDRQFLFDFTHDETPNDANPCADGGTVGVGVDVNGCADHVTVANDMLSETFLIGTDTYTLAIDGFRDPVTGVPHSDFWTEESALNPADLLARVTLQQPQPAPEPTSLALLGTGLFGLIVLRRRRHRGSV